jgi:hypothetical protein
MVSIYIFSGPSVGDSPDKVLPRECTSYIDWDQSWYFQSPQRNSGWIFKLCYNLHSQSLTSCITCSANTTGVGTQCEMHKSIKYFLCRDIYIHFVSHSPTLIPCLYQCKPQVDQSITVHTAEQLTHRLQNLQIVWWNDSPIYHSLIEQRAKQLI